MFVCSHKDKETSSYVSASTKSTIATVQPSQSLWQLAIGQGTQNKLEP